MFRAFSGFRGGAHLHEVDSRVQAKCVSENTWSIRCVYICACYIENLIFIHYSLNSLNTVNDKEIYFIKVVGQYNSHVYKSNITDLFIND